MYIDTICTLYAVFQLGLHTTCPTCPTTSGLQAIVTMVTLTPRDGNFTKMGGFHRKSKNGGPSMIFL